MIILIDAKTIEQARGADVVAFLEKHSGFTFNHKGGAYRCQQHPSLAVKDNRLSWCWHSKGMGGHGVLDYLTKVENMPFREAVETVTGISAASAQLRLETEKPKTLILPEKSGTALRLYDYLCGKRGIDSGIVNALVQEGKLYEDKRGNVVFVGYDDNGKARFASLRGTYGDCRFRVDCNGSDKRYGFNIISPTSERLYVYESAIDLMSHASLENIATGDMGAWKRHNRLSLSGTSDAALDFFLNKQKTVTELVFSLDNDKAGREAAAIMADKYASRGYNVRTELPVAKDFSNDLISIANKTRQGQALSRTSPHTNRGGLG